MGSNIRALKTRATKVAGGYRIQGRDDDGAARLLREARELAEAGASMLVVELIPSTLGQQLTESLPIPVIGIGAGPGCSGQVLVLHDMLGITRGKLPRFQAGAFESNAALLVRHLGQHAALLCGIRLARFDVIVTTNLFGDILSDIASYWGGGLGLATISGLTLLMQDNKDRQMMARIGGMKS